MEWLPPAAAAVRQQRRPTRRHGAKRAWLLFAGLCATLWSAQAQSPRTGDVGRDTLVYKDGDRIHGLLVGRTGDLIIFKSDRFGELRVPVADAVVIERELPARTAPTAGRELAKGTAPKPAAEREEEEQVRVWEWFSPAVLTARVRSFFGPWHGRLAFSNDMVTDTAHRDNLAVESRLQRTYTTDVVDLNGRYDYNRTNGLLTADLLRAVGSWRHDFDRQKFGQYRSTVEWNRVQLRKDLPEKYLFWLQEVGVGRSIWSTPARKLRLGVSENLFEVWNTDPTNHTWRAVESIFNESEFALPWRMTLSQRGVWYPLPNHGDSCENRIELNTKLTETLSVALQHEIRRNNPDGRSLNYSRLRMLLGLDF